MSEWISVKDKFPVLETLVICYGNEANSVPFICYRSAFIGLHWIENESGEVITGVTNWMPLPELPK